MVVALSDGKERIRWLAGAAALVLALVLFRPTFAWMAYEFDLPRNDLSHGWLVPLFSAYVIGLRRRELARALAAGRPDGRGFLLFLFGLALFWLGSRGGQMRFCHLALLVQAWAIPLALFGVGLARLLVFPVLFLAFTMPMGFLDFFTIRLRLLTASSSAFLLSGMGIPVVREGTALRSLAGSGFNLDVADPCSGLRSLFAMAALTAAYAFLAVRGRFRQWTLFLFAAPLAIVGNIARILSITWIARFFGVEAATGFYHDYSGYVVFLVAVLLMVRIGGVIGRLPRRRWEAFLDRVAEAPPGAAAPGDPWRRRDRLLALAVPLALAAVLAVQSRLPEPTVDAADRIPADLPAAFGDFHGDVPLFCHNEQCLRRTLQAELPADRAAWRCPQCGGPLQDRSLGEATVLPADTLIRKRLYTSAREGDIELSMVVSGRSRMSIHRPELCLPAQGFAMTRARTVSVPLPGRAPLRVRVVHVRKGDAGFVLCYWFASGGRETPSHLARILRDAWSRSVHNRINRWVMFALTLQPPSGSEAADEAVRRAVAGVYTPILAAGGDASW